MQVRFLIIYLPLNQSINVPGDSGHVTMADSHFLYSMLQQRIVGGYYLGCPMSDAVMAEFTSLLHQLHASTGDTFEDFKDRIIRKVNFNFEL